MFAVLSKGIRSSTECWELKVDAIPIRGWTY